MLPSMNDETPQQFMARRETELRAEEQAEDQEERRKNQDFAMIYDRRGSGVLREVAQKSGQAIALFFTLIEHMDRKGSLVVSNETLAEVVGATHVQNISRALNLLRDHGVIYIHTKGIRVICVNPEIAWRSTAEGKQYALFNARVMIPKAEVDAAQAEATRRYQAAERRLEDRMQKVRAIVKKPSKQRDLPPPVGPEPAVEAKLEPAGKVPVTRPKLNIRRPNNKTAK